MYKISIITVCFNSAKTIAETIESVLSQDYPHVEYIVIDGKSTDTTVDVVKSYGSRITQLVSERDKGLYDAMNKGIQLATGDIVSILHSDDLYADNQVLSKIARTIKEKNVDVVYGDLYYFKNGLPDQALRYYKGGVFSLSRVSYGLMPPHPTFFIRKSVYEKYGSFDTQYTLSADFDLILRFLGVHKVPFEYLPEILVKMRIGGVSTRSLKTTLIMNKEDLDSCKKHGVQTNMFKFYSKYLTKILHLFK